MSKIVILAEATEGHFNPFVPIIKRFVARGHQVVCITGTSFKKRVENTGAAFHPLPRQWDPGDQDVYDFFPILKQHRGLSQVKYYLKYVLYDQVPDVLNALEDVLATFPAQVVLSDTFMMAGVWITELGGPPSVRVSLLPLSLPGRGLAPFGFGLLPGTSFVTKFRNNLLGLIVDKLLFRNVQTHINTIRNALDLPPYATSFFVEGFEKPNLVLHMSTPTFEYPRAEFPQNFRFIGPVLVSPDDGYMKPKWWPKGEDTLPVILINQGTIAKNHDDLISPAIEALRSEKVTVIVVPVKEGQIKYLPENTHAEAFIPFGNLLPHVDIMITNGGFGGTQNALAHGIPLVIAGASEDKMEVAARVEYSGAGINLRKKRPSPEDISKAIIEILSKPSYRQKAKALQTEFARYDAPARAVDLVEELIESTKEQSNENQGVKAVEKVK